MDVYFASKVGSSTYNLQLESSDIDIACITDIWNTSKHVDGIHFICIPKEEFVQRILSNNINPLYLQWLFPKDTIIQCELWNYVFNNRENIIAASKNKVWNNFINRAKAFQNDIKHWYPIYPKRIVYSILFYNTIIEYASGRLFAEAFIPDDSLRDKLLSIRRNDMPVEDVIALNNLYEERALRCKDFYDEPLDEEFRSQFEQEVNRLLNDLPPIDFESFYNNNFKTQ